MRERLAYLHFPKSAGTSVRAAFETYYGLEDTCPSTFDPYMFVPYPNMDRVDRPLFFGDPAELRSYRYLQGHWSLPAVLEGFDASDVVCVLRDPRARLLSHYSFWRTWPDEHHEVWEHYDVSLLARRRLSEFLTHPMAMPQADNIMTRLTLGPHPLVPTHAPIAAEDIDAVAGEACDLLDKLGYVDVLERGEAMWDDLEQWFGSELPRSRKNETELDDGERIDLDDLVDRETMRLVQDRSAADLQLWQHVASRRIGDAVAVRSMADASFGSTLARIAIAHARPLPEPETETTDSDVGDASMGHDALLPAVRPPAPIRLARLVRRGPRVWAQRIGDEVAYRRGHLTKP